MSQQRSVVLNIRGSRSSESPSKWLVRIDGLVGGRRVVVVGSGADHGAALQAAQIAFSQKEGYARE